MRHFSLSKDFRSKESIKTTAYRENISALALVQAVLTEAQRDHGRLPFKNRRREHREPEFRQD